MTTWYEKEITTSYCKGGNETWMALVEWPDFDLVACRGNQINERLAFTFFQTRQTIMINLKKSHTNMDVRKANFYASFDFLAN